MSRQIRIILCIAVPLFIFHYSSAVETTLNGEECDDDTIDITEKPCSCYSVLENSLLAKEKNRIDLRKAFFPPGSNSPEFVSVLYSFENSTATSVWFWSAKTSHFLHPFKVFQFLSLLFSKPEPYYTGKVKITLRKECANLSSDDLNLQLLTQRVCSNNYEINTGALCIKVKLVHINF